MVLRNSHDDMYSKLKDISKHRSIIESLNETENIKKRFKEAQIYTVSFSDSIILFSSGGTEEDAELLTQATSFLFAKAIEKNIPLKGAMAVGKMTVDKENQIFFGQPLIDAYLLEEDLYYYGVVAHHTMVHYLNNLKGKFKYQFHFFSKKTPLKGGNALHLNLNWKKALGIIIGDKTQIKFEDKMKEFTGLVSGKPAQYLDNTIDMFKD